MKVLLIIVTILSFSRQVIFASSAVINIPCVKLCYIWGIADIEYPMRNPVRFDESLSNHLVFCLKEKGFAEIQNLGIKSLESRTSFLNKNQEPSLKFIKSLEKKGVKLLIWGKFYKTTKSNVSLQIIFFSIDKFANILKIKKNLKKKQNWKTVLKDIIRGISIKNISRECNQVKVITNPSIKRAINNVYELGVDRLIKWFVQGKFPKLRNKLKDNKQAIIKGNDNIIITLNDFFNLLVKMKLKLQMTNDGNEKENEVEKLSNGNCRVSIPIKLTVEGDKFNFNKDSKILTIYVIKLHNGKYEIKLGNIYLFSRKSEVPRY